MSKRAEGKPPFYKSAEEMQVKIDEYFEKCNGTPVLINGEPVLDKHGMPVITGAEPPTVTGLALALGFKSRQALLNYQGKSAFESTILTAKLRVEHYAEMRLFDREGVRGAEFSLMNNYGWKTEQVSEKETEAIAKLDALLGGITDAAKR